MKRIHVSITSKFLSHYLLALFTVAAITIPLVLIGKDALGEAVIVLLYLLPVAWSASKWGQGPAVIAALAAALAFDFFFVPPIYTFAVGRLEGWLVLVIFLTVAIVVVGRIQSNLSRARNAVFMYELSSALTGMHTQEAVAYTVAKYLAQLFQATIVKVAYQPKLHSPSVIVSEPHDGIGKGKPDRVIPILNAWGLVGEIQIWQGEFLELPLEGSVLLQNFAFQTAQALERTRLAETGGGINNIYPQS